MQMEMIGPYGKAAFAPAEPASAAEIDFAPDFELSHG
jgi:hypothetical protein